MWFGYSKRITSEITTPSEKAFPGDGNDLRRLLAANIHSDQQKALLGIVSLKGSAGTYNSTPKIVWWLSTNHWASIALMASKLPPPSVVLGLRIVAFCAHKEATNDIWWPSCALRSWQIIPGRSQRRLTDVREPSRIRFERNKSPRTSPQRAKPKEKYRKIVVIQISVSEATNVFHHYFCDLAHLAPSIFFPLRSHLVTESWLPPLFIWWSKSLQAPRMNIDWWYHSGYHSDPCQ